MLKNDSSNSTANYNENRDVVNKNNCTSLEAESHGILPISKTFANNECKLLTNPVTGRLSPCTTDSKQCPKWDIRQSILEECQQSTEQENNDKKEKNAKKKRKTN